MYMSKVIVLSACACVDVYVKFTVTHMAMQENLSESVLISPQSVYLNLRTGMYMYIHALVHTVYCIWSLVY